MIGGVSTGRAGAPIDQHLLATGWAHSSKQVFNSEFIYNNNNTRLTALFPDYPGEPVPER